MPVVLLGMSASAGVAVGPAHAVVTSVTAPAAVVMTVEQALARTAERFERDAAVAELAQRATEAEVLEAYGMLARDPSLAEAVQRRVDGGAGPVEAVRAAGEELAAELAALENTYLAERSGDVIAVAEQVVRTLQGTADRAVEVPDGAVVCARDLSPADTVRMDLSRVAGLVTERGGPTSHTAIVARSHGVPAVVGVAGLLAAIVDGVVLAVDGTAGKVTVDPGAETVAQAQAVILHAQQRAAHQRTLRGRRVSFAGDRVLVAANVGGPPDVAEARATAADGIGLYRSEFLFLAGDQAPTREQQLVVYGDAAAAFADPVVVRTLDIGGDKEVAYLELPHEDNPFLGIRGLRLSLAHPELFATQLDAAIAARDRGDLQLMFPMVATLADLEAGLAFLAQRARLAGAQPPPAGVMIETPAAALLAGHLASRAAFFSIGTNDLTQYTMAADRMGGELGGYQDPLHPSVLRLIALTVEGARAGGIPVAVCGEAAGDPAGAALLLGLGVRELSMAAPLVDAARMLVEEFDPIACQAAAQRALTLPDAAAVRELAAPLLP